MYTIDLASEKDLPLLMKFAQGLHAESTYSGLKYSPQKVEGALLDCINGDYGVTLVLCRKGEPIGAVAGLLKNFLFSADTVAIEIMYYVLPEFRRARASLALLDAFEVWAQKQGAKAVWLGSFPGHPIQRVYTQKGYKISEESFVKWLSPVQ